jgi:hypothetical protein
MSGLMVDMQCILLFSLHRSRSLTVGAQGIE